MSQVVGIFATLLVVVLLCSKGVVESVPNTDIKDVECNPNNWVTNDPYGVNVGYCIRDLVITTPTRPGYIHSMESLYRGTSVFGMGRCTNLRLSDEDCFTCLTNIQTNLPRWCPFAIGASMLLVDCSIRYETYPF